MSNIEELERREAELRKELAEVQARLRDAKVEKSGVRIGEIVHSKGILYRVTHIDGNWSKAWLKGNPQRKDGTFGTAERHLYSSWEKLP